jgi:hypothetical protein
MLSPYVGLAMVAGYLVDQHLFAGTYETAFSQIAVNILHHFGVV